MEASTATVPVSEMQPRPSTPQKRAWLWIGALVILLIILGGSYWYYRSAQTGTEIAPGAHYVSAPAGQLIQSFPREMLLEPGAALERSYRIDYKDLNTTQSLAAYVSPLSVRDNIQAFRTYFVTHSWEILHTGSPSELPATFIFATKGKEQANVSLQPLPDEKTEVTITYSVKN